MKDIGMLLMGAFTLIVMIVSFMTLGTINTLVVAGSGAAAYHLYCHYFGKPSVGGYDAMVG